MKIFYCIGFVVLFYAPSAFAPLAPLPLPKIDPPIVPPSLPLPLPKIDPPIVPPSLPPPLPKIDPPIVLPSLPPPLPKIDPPIVPPTLPPPLPQLDSPVTTPVIDLPQLPIDDLPLPIDEPISPIVDPPIPTDKPILPIDDLPPPIDEPVSLIDDLPIPTDKPISPTDIPDLPIDPLSPPIYPEEPPPHKLPHPIYPPVHQNGRPLIRACPTYKYNSSIVCNPSCHDDYFGIDTCTDGKVCCPSQCGESCAEPDLEGLCKPFVYDESISCYFTCHDQFGKDLCTDGEICCWGQCGEFCTEPDYYQVYCPEESILELDEPWQRLTSFCLEDCECHYDAKICCESPCGCDLDICRNPVIKKAECPDYCTYNYNYYYYYDDCSTFDYCYQFGQICCDCYGSSICQDPKFVNGPSSLWEIGNPEIPKDYDYGLLAT